MRNKTTIPLVITVLVIIGFPLFADTLTHYPFHRSGEHFRSDCRAYAMARAYGGNYCGGNIEYICGTSSISGVMWDTIGYSFEQAGEDGYNIIAWDGHSNRD